MATFSAFFGNVTITPSFVSPGVSVSPPGATPSAASDTIFTSFGNDTAEGGGGDDVANLGAGKDTYIWNAGDGEDLVFAGGGNDTLQLNGSDSADSINVVGSFGGLVVSIDRDNGVQAFSVEDTVIDAKDGNDIVNALALGPGVTRLKIYGGLGDDIVLGSLFNDTVYGNGGTDILVGFLGNDYLDGGDGTDFVLGDALSLSEIVSIAGLLGFSSPLLTEAAQKLDALLNPISGNDELHGGAGFDVLFGGGGNDRLFGEADTDLLIGGPGVNQLDGGGALDFAAYFASSSGVTANLSTGTATTANGDTTDTLTSIEGVIGSDYADNLTGGAGDLSVPAVQRVSVLVGLDGDDTLNGGSAQTNLLIGGADDDALTAGSGAINVLLGDGLSLSDLESAVNAIVPGLGTVLVGALPDIGSLGSLFGTGSGNDTLTGGANGDIMFGGAGNDTLNGNAGLDLMNGGAGVDVLNGGTAGDSLTGGAEADTFKIAPGDTINPDTLNLLPIAGGAVFGSAAAQIAALGVGMDVILDFEDGVDLIDLKAFGLVSPTVIDANSPSFPSGNAVRVDVVNVLTTGDAIVYINNSTTSGGSFAPDKYDAAIYVVGGAADTWTAADFVFV